MKVKKFDAVEMMRNIREKLDEKYANNPEQLDKDLTSIRKAYSNLFEQKANLTKSRGIKLT